MKLRTFYTITCLPNNDRKANINFTITQHLYIANLIEKCVTVFVVTCYYYMIILIYNIQNVHIHITQNKIIKAPVWINLYSNRVEGSSII